MKDFMTIRELINFVEANNIDLDSAIFISNHAKYSGYYLLNGQRASPIIKIEKTELYNPYSILYEVIPTHVLYIEIEDGE